MAYDELVVAALVGSGAAPARAAAALRDPVHERHDGPAEGCGALQPGAVGPADGVRSRLSAAARVVVPAVPADVPHRVQPELRLRVHRLARTSSSRQSRPDAVFDAPRTHPTHHVLMVPTMINMVLNHPDIESADWSCVDTIVYGASTIPPDVLEHAIEVMGCGSCRCTA